MVSGTGAKDTPMSDEIPIFGQLSQLSPSGSTRNSKEVPVDKESHRKAKGRRKEPPKANQGEDAELEEAAENTAERPSSGKVLDITI